MSVNALQGKAVRLVAGNTYLDLFEDEEILIDNNTTELMDLGAVPATVVRSLQLPGSKKNNAFFQTAANFDINGSTQWESKNKIRAYLEMDNNYLVDGYIQINKVNTYQGKLVDSYDVTLFGIISNLSVDLKTKFLTDTVGLSKYNHTASWSNVTKSWNGELFNGDVVYAMVDAGQQYYYSSAERLGLDEPEGAVNIRDLKPAVRIRKVWDAMIEDAGYTSTGSFWMQPWLNNVYLIANNSKDSLILTNSVDLNDYGTFKLNNQKSSSLSSNQDYSFDSLGFYGVEYNNNNKYDAYSGSYNLDYYSPLKGKIRLKFTLAGTSSIGQVPTYPAGFRIYARRVSDNVVMGQSYLPNINKAYIDGVQSPFSSSFLAAKANGVPGKYTQQFDLEEEFAIEYIPSGSYKFSLFVERGSTSDLPIIIDSGSNSYESSFQIDHIDFAADGQIVDMVANMPKGGEGGIKQIDLLTGLQKKFNLCIYQDKTTPNQVVCETFNDFYKLGIVKDFNQFVNEREAISIEPLHAYTINKVEFTDKRDSDYVSTVFEREYNRTFGAAFHIDTASYYSQGEFKVESSFASSPLVAVPGMASTADVNTSYNYLLANRSTTLGITMSYTDNGGTNQQAKIPASSNTTVCARNTPYPYDYISSLWNTVTKGSSCGTYGSTFATPNQFYIPYYIADDKYKPATVLPRLMFYNGQKDTEPWHYRGMDTPYSITSSTYPYFDNYSAEDLAEGPTTSSKSLLFLNETPIFGMTPTSSLLDTYWSTYLDLYYKSDAKVLKCSAVVPIAAYSTMELNDLISYRSNIYHLRAINEYSLTTGECKLELLGPIIPDALSSILSQATGSNLITGIWDTDAEIWNLSELLWDI